MRKYRIRKCDKITEKCNKFQALGESFLRNRKEPGKRPGARPENYVNHLFNCVDYFKVGVGEVCFSSFSGCIQTSEV